ncbi:3,4-dihydroxy-2-butanone-4-phosphate synthase (plasmid) [Thioclava sp. 'Guangxiensis']|uniref:3,4-dihydroxy-2-butanone-4-phosphate synthase n=1 Tax=Thioclava sp. 'Guangxiensis' TaxID=3149044 RepID=UPI0032C4393E
MIIIAPPAPAGLAATRALAASRPVIVTGCQGGAFVLIAARDADANWINIMARDARGLVGMVMPLEHAQGLGLELQPQRGGRNAPLYTQSIEATIGISTGISAKDRACTIAAATTGAPDAVVSPGHVFPQVPNGCADGQADIALRLLGDAGLAPLGVICTILDSKGRDAGPETVAALATDLDAEIIAASDLM